MRLAIAGDMAFCGLISTSSEANHERFRWLEETLSGCDGLIANLEAPVASDERNRAKKVFLHADPIVTRDLLRRLNVKCVSLANNHILDCGRQGLANTIRLLDSAGICHSGAGLTPEQAAPVIFPLAGKSIAFAAYNHGSTNPGGEAYPDLFLNTFDPDQVATEVRSLKEEADIVIASIHWGTDYSFFHEPWQRETAAIIAEAGADIIMGHHSHTLQAFETLGSSQVFYGLGSLVFGDFEKNGRMYALYRRTKHSAVFFTDANCRLLEAVATHELKGNYIVAGRKDIMKRNERLLRLNRIRAKNSSLSSMLRFHEKVLSRIHEYFFGYYMNPLIRLFQFRNFRKAVRLLRQRR